MSPNSITFMSTPKVNYYAVPTTLWKSCKNVFHLCFPRPSSFCQNKNWRLVCGDEKCKQIYMQMVFLQYNISDRLDQDWSVKLIAVKFYNPSDWPISFRLHAWPLDTWTHDDSMIHWWLCNNYHTYNEVRMIWTGICYDCFRVYLKIHYSLSIWRLIWTPFKLPFDWFHIKGVFSTYWVWRWEVWMTSAGFKGGAKSNYSIIKSLKCIVYNKNVVSI